MRLINTNTLQLEDFSSGKVPPYAILSHTWEQGEISFQTWSSPWQWLLRTRDNKITQACRLAKSYKLGYIWIDTCCIDKTDSVELGEAINSMFRWYQNASICFAYLSDLPAAADFETGFALCRWHTRGWTLPELIAPSKVEFYDQEWLPRGTKHDHKRLLEKHTRIPAAVLTSEQQLDACSVSDRLSWASSRKTTKPEDAAYCLLGIFNVHMPLIYGEGQEAFYRLQETIKHKYQHRSESTSLRARQQRQKAIEWPEQAPHTLTLRVPSELVISRYKSDSYPTNLLDLKNNFIQPTIHRDGLEDAMSQLCTDNPFSVKVGFADLITGQYRHSYQEVSNEADLAQQLGDESAVLPPGEVISKPDPRNRFILLEASNQTGSLQITKRMLVRIFTHHQVPMQHMNLLFLFGRENPMTGVRYDSFWGQVAFGQPMPGLEAPDLGRSGKHYEISFNLKGISADSIDPETSTPEFPHTGAVCNVAIYHKLDIIHGTSIWIITKPGGGLSRCIGPEASDYGGDGTRTFATPTECYISSLEIHVTLARWAGESWWAYFQNLEKLIEDRTGPAVLADSKETYTAADLKTLQAYAEKVSEAVAVLGTNLRILQALPMFYNKLLSHNQFALAQEARQATEDFSNQLQDINRDFEGQVSRGIHLMAFVKARKELILELMQAHTSDRTMELAQASAREALFMRIVTVVTVLYLPATFVSTFFSTDIIRYQKNPSQLTSDFSYTAFWRWIQIAVPLSIVTVVATIIAYRLSLRSQRGRLPPPRTLPNTIAQSLGGRDRSIKKLR